MRLLFTHDLPLMRREGRVYSAVDKNALLENYALLAEDIVFLCREAAALEHMSEITYPRFSFIPVPNLNSAAGLIRRFKEASCLIEEAVAQVDMGVFRMPSLISFLAAYHARRRGLPYMIEVVSCPWDALWNHSAWGRAAAPFFTLAQRLLVRDAPYVLYVSERFLQGRYPSRGRCVSCSDVELPPEPSLEAGEGLLRRRLERLSSLSSSAPLVLGTAGALDVPYKGQRFVIRVLARLRRRGMDIEYRLAGSGDASALLAEAEKLGVRDLVRVLGALPHEEMFGFFDGLDVYVQPSLQEGLPRAAVEAMSRACPVIGSSAGGIPELLEPTCVFPKGDTAALECLLAVLWQDRTRLAGMARESFARASAFRPAVLGRKRRDFYAAFLAEQGARG
ncbi:glycosyltransferase family 4 protein [Mailhella sp.]|uniref:glycosyltransferase family 4 protein n=1 Tax=Mailhella sp. TaxID=1981029 RepID=UPI0040631FDC